ncbi:AAEL014579-PA [Aedes aegypti]|uniref:AAEL014579-PA n=1 Tax=Aedes aegypti TaxID=7159 RepID=Q16FZ5_AEDAE|nr:AAEL014579-PA [Aedes aegypti]
MRFLVGLLVFSLGAESVRSLTSASDTRAPFVVSLENEGGQFCSGTIVTNNWILTAASCVWNKQAIEISVGIQPLDVHSGSYHRRALKMYVHPDYVPHASGANIALLKLKRPIEWNGLSIMMKLANDSAELQKMSDCLMVGWDRSQRAPNHLKPVDLPSEKCFDKISQSLCLNETDDQLCKFREGSPMLCVHQEKFVQVGFLSGIENCDSENTSYAVSSVVHFHEWMMNVIQHKNLIQDLQSEKGYLRRLSRFNWLILAVLVFVASVVILIQVLRSRFRLM